MDKVERHSGGRSVYSCGRKGWVVGVPNLFLKNHQRLFCFTLFSWNFDQPCKAFEIVIFVDQARHEQNSFQYFPPASLKKKTIRDGGTTAL